MEAEIERKIAEAALSAQPCDGKDGDFHVVKAEATIEETIAKRRSVAEFSTAAAIDIDDAEWHKEYCRRADSNVELLKSLGLYSQLQELGILYDPTQFRKSYSIVKNKSIGTQICVPN